MDRGVFIVNVLVVVDLRGEREFFICQVADVILLKRYFSCLLQSFRLYPTLCDAMDEL